MFDVVISIQNICQCEGAWTCSGCTMPWSNEDMFAAKVLLVQVTFHYILLVLGLWKSVIFELGATRVAISTLPDLVQCMKKIFH